MPKKSSPHPHKEAFKFWVVGGEYASTEFSEVVEGTQDLVGPFYSREAAESAWRNLSDRHRSKALVRYAIASESYRTVA